MKKRRRIMIMGIYCLETADTGCMDRFTGLRISPLVEENEHRDTVQRLSRQHWQQLDAGRGYLRDVGRIHHKLWKEKEIFSQISTAVRAVTNTHSMKANAYNDRWAVTEVTWPYWAHAASQLSQCHFPPPLQRQVYEVGSYLWREKALEALRH